MNPTPADFEVAKRSLFYVGCSAIVRTASAVYFRMRAVNVHQVPRTGPVILASNHVSYLDPPLIGCTLPRKIHSMARKSLFQNRLLTPIMRGLAALPIDRDGGGGAGLKTIFERLEAGAGVLLFPEGTRSPDGRVHPAKAGIGLIIIRSTAPVIPVRMIGAYEAWGRHLRLPRPARITIVYGSPIDFREMRAEAKTCDKARLKAIYQQVADETMNAIQNLGDESHPSNSSC
jgi:1-acyl-sn-glycerol-3-phosphate acyltransferase